MNIRLIRPILFFGCIFFFIFSIRADAAESLHEKIDAGIEARFAKWKVDPINSVAAIADDGRICPPCLSRFDRKNSFFPVRLAFFS